MRGFTSTSIVASLANMRRRAAIGHEAVLAAFRGGARSELELHLAYLAATHQDDPETPYKNIVALKGTPADQLMPAMQFISASLGMRCDSFLSSRALRLPINKTVIISACS